MSTLNFIKNLDETERIVFQNEFNKKKKSSVVFFLLWSTLGLIGAHKDYLEETVASYLYFLFGIIGHSFFFLALFSGASNPIFYIPSFIIALFCLNDLFNMSNKINITNSKIEKQIYEEIISCRNELENDNNPKDSIAWYKKATKIIGVLLSIIVLSLFFFLVFYMYKNNEFDNQSKFCSEGNLDSCYEAMKLTDNKELKHHLQEVIKSYEELRGY